MGIINDSKTHDVDYGLGPNGPDAPKVYSGTGPPIGAAQEGSFYIQDNGNIWKYLSGSWAKESFDDITEAEGFVSNGTEQTASDGWVSKTGFPWTTTETKTAGKFSLRWFMEVGQTKATRNFGYRVLWRPTGGAWTILSEISSATVAKDGNKGQQSGFKEITLPTDNTIEMDIQHGQTIDGFESIISNVSVEVRRLGD